VQDILIQLNLSGERTKSGIEAAVAQDLLMDVGQLKNISVKGLMTMPPFFDDPQRARPYFKALYELKARLQSIDLPNVALDELSMGMTGDFETAIEEGATLVRIGTAIFGART
jgi:pyridoxal phosphate enzyme (YggS family)